MGNKLIENRAYTIITCGNKLKVLIPKIYLIKDIVVVTMGNITIKYKDSIGTFSDTIKFEKISM